MIRISMKDDTIKIRGRAGKRNGPLPRRCVLWQEGVMTRRLPRLGALLALGMALGCGGPKAVPSQEPAVLPLEVQVIASSRLNLDEQGESLPTVIRLYQLKSTSKLDRTEYDQVYRDPKEALGEDLLQADELVLSPGQTVRRRVERERTAKALAVVAVVRRPAGLSWRAVADLPPPAQRAELTFSVEGYRVERR
jgi:type VI secretion system VasD/TssJ family lipoprotein